MTKPLRSLDLIRRLIAFDTVSRNSNMALIAFVQETLADLGVESHLTQNDDGDKANLYATIGPADRPGICLSGHTDVVPVDGQDWSTDPFAPVEKDGRIYGRGTCDMKSFIAAALAFAPDFAARLRDVPVHFAFSYDEELGCLGAPRLIAALDAMPVKPAMCIIGEPTNMQVITGHKGKRDMLCRVRGHESHSAYVHLGVNAIEIAAELIGFLGAIGKRRREDGPLNDKFDPPFTTVHVGVIGGGTQLNIVPRDCSFEFEVRNLPDDDPSAIVAEVEDFAAREIVPRMKDVSPDAGIFFEERARYPGLNTGEDEEVVRFVKRLAQSNDTSTVSFGTEAGLFDGAGIPTVVCGPGSIAQAHKPDEFVSLDQVAACENFMARLLDEIAPAN